MGKVDRRGQQNALFVTPSQTIWSSKFFADIDWFIVFRSRSDAYIELEI